MARAGKPKAKTVPWSSVITIGHFGQVVRQETIDRVLRRLGRPTDAGAGGFPPWLAVYWLMYRPARGEADEETLFGLFTEAAQHLPWGLKVEDFSWPSAISEARSRLGAEGMRLIAAETLRPVAGPDIPGAFYRGLRLAALDLSRFDLPGRPENAAFFGHPGGSGGEAATVLSLVETGSRAVMAAEIGGRRADERVMAASLFESGQLGPDTLLLARESCFGCQTWSKAAATGAKLLWGTGPGFDPPVVDPLPDGSYVGLLPNDRGGKAEPVRVRVIGHTLDEPGLAPEDGQSGDMEFKIATNLLDHEAAPAKELAELHHRSSKVENLFGIFREARRDARCPIVSGQTPESVLEELWGMILADFALRSLLVETGWVSYSFRPGRGKPKPKSGRPKSR